MTTTLSKEAKSIDFKALQMYLLSNYPFYYALVQQCKISMDDKSKYIAYVKVSTKMEMVINPIMFAEFSTAEQAGMLVHELQHLFKDHIKQTNLKQVEAIAEKIGSEPNHMQANIAMDVEINPYVSELKNSEKFGPLAPKGDKDTDSFRGVWPEDFKLQSGDSWFNYYAQLEQDPAIKKMKKNQKKMEEAFKKALEEAQKNGSQPGEADQSGGSGHEPGEGKPHQDHEYFKVSTKDSKMLDEIAANAAKRAKSLTHGNTPHEIEKFLIQYEISKQIPWHVVLRQFMQSLTDVKTKNTWKKANRRFRGKLPGAKKLPKLELLIGIDSSGSVVDEDLVKFYAEVDAINAVGNVKIDIAVFDTLIHQREEYHRGFEASRKCSGGTSFIPVHELAIEERYKGVIYLTDGYANFPDASEVSYKCLWVLNSDVQPPYGNTVRIK